MVAVPLLSIMFVVRTHRNKDSVEVSATEVIVENRDFANSKKKATDDFDGTDTSF